MQTINLELPDRKTALADLLSANAHRIVGNGKILAAEERTELVQQGSVWLGKRRIKDPLALVCSADASCIVINLPQKPLCRFVMDPDLVCHEDDELLVVWKPEQINTCPSVFSDWDCLSSGVQDYLESRGLTHRVNTIHRLDRAARGLVMFGKTPSAEAWLYHIFAQRKVHKYYLGACPVFEGMQSHYRMEGDQEHRGKVRWASTIVHLLDREYVLPDSGKAVARFLACPETGRPHQIRKHFAYNLMPLQGDAAYGGYSPLDRLELACVGYRYLHPSGSWEHLRVQDPWLDKKKENPHKKVTPHTCQIVE